MNGVDDALLQRVIDRIMYTMDGYDDGGADDIDRLSDGFTAFLANRRVVTAIMEEIRQQQQQQQQEPQEPQEPQPLLPQEGGRHRSSKSRQSRKSRNTRRRR